MRKPNGFRLLGLGLGGGIEVRHTRLVIRLPDPRLLRLVARTLLLAAAILSLFWLREGSDIVSDDAARQRTAVGADDVFLYTLLRDMRHRDLLRPKDRAVFFNEADASDRSMSMQEASADFVFSAFAGDFDRIDRILKPGGVLAVQLSSNPSESFQPPANYRTAYFGRIGSATVVAMRKSLASEGGMRLRRLLAVPEARKEALSGLEGVLLEPPYRQGWRRAAKYLPELTGDKLDGYPRRVFVEVAAAGEASSGAAWFERHYPRKGRTFEVIRVEVEEESDEAEEKGEEASPSLAEWLERNVREEEYVVVKAEGAIGLVDELFLECDHQLWEEDEKKKQKARKGGRRAYWECLVLYGKLRDAGVAVHQWWNF